MNLFKTFRIVAIVEATSFLLLLIATGVKYGADEAVGVEILGPVHGTLFLGYVVLALFVKLDREWSIVTTLLVLAGAVLPFGGYVVDRWLGKQVQPR